MASTSITVYYRVRGKWAARFWMLAARLPGIDPYRRLRFVSNAIASIRVEMSIGKKGQWQPCAVGHFEPSTKSMKLVQS